MHVLSFARAKLMERHKILQLYVQELSSDYFTYIHSFLVVAIISIDNIQDVFCNTISNPKDKGMS